MPPQCQPTRENGAEEESQDDGHNIFTMRNEFGAKNCINPVSCQIKMMKTLTKSALVVVVFLLASPVVMACYCLTPEVQEGFGRAQAVFLGEVTEIIPPRNTAKDAPFTDRAYIIRFKVERTWKGSFFVEAEAFALRDECFSLPPLVKAEKYLVYADAVLDSPKSTDVFIHACSRTSSVSAPRTEFRLVGPTPDRSIENEIRALNGLMIMPPASKPRPDPFSRMNFLEP